MNLPRECPGQISWHYGRAEIIADGVVHAIGVCLGLIGAVTLVVMAVTRARLCEHFPRLQEQLLIGRNKISSAGGRFLGRFRECLRLGNRFGDHT